MIDNSHDLHVSNCDIILRICDRSLQRISEMHLFYDPLYYMLLFLYGNDSWHMNIPLTVFAKRKRVTTMQFYSYRLQIRDRDWFNNAGRLY